MPAHSELVEGRAAQPFSPLVVPPGEIKTGMQKKGPPRIRLGQCIFPDQQQSQEAFGFMERYSTDASTL